MEDKYSQNGICTDLLCGHIVFRFTIFPTAINDLTTSGPV